MAPQPLQPDGKTFVAAVTTVAAAYVYFLIFAQFGFLQAVALALGAEAGVVRPLMGWMGLAGIAGSVAAARFFSELRARRWLAAGFGFCAAAALGSMGARNFAAFAAVAGLTGLGVGLITVTLAGMLRRAAGDGRLGLIIGLGTGLAYGFCNLPGIFEASAAIQAGMAVVAAIAGLAAGRMLRPKLPVELRKHGDYSAGSAAAWVLVFLALVCLDSALFYFIQHTPGLKTALWSGAGRQALNAGMHLGAALLAGWALDRGWLGRIVLPAAIALVAAAAWIQGRWTGFAASGLIYIAGVSAYSTALVFYPARSGRPGLAALLYAVAGWGGSALGIGLAEGCGGIPLGLLIGAPVVFAMGLGWRHLASHGGGQ